MSRYEAAFKKMARMAGSHDPEVVAVYRVAMTSDDLHAAWIDGGQPGTWKNVQRGFPKWKLWQQASEAAADAELHALAKRGEPTRLEQATFT